MSNLDEQFQEEDNLQIDEGIRELLASPNGRYFIWWMLELTHIFQNAFGESAKRTAFLLGEQNIGQHLLARIASLSPQGWFELEKEMNDVRRRRDLSRRASAGTDSGADSGAND